MRIEINTETFVQGNPVRMATDPGVREAAIGVAGNSLHSVYKITHAHVEDIKDSTIAVFGPSTQREAVSVLSAAQKVTPNLDELSAQLTDRRPWSMEDEARFNQRNAELGGEMRQPGALARTMSKAKNWCR